MEVGGCQLSVSRLDIFNLQSSVYEGFKGEFGKVLENFVSVMNWKRFETIVERAYQGLRRSVNGL